MTDTLHRRSLDTIGDDVLEVASALVQLTRPEIECLRTVIHCREYIFWLREEVKGVGLLLFSVKFAYIYFRPQFIVSYSLIIWIEIF